MPSSFKILVKEENSQKTSGRPRGVAKSIPKMQGKHQHKTTKRPITTSSFIRHTHQRFPESSSSSSTNTITPLECFHHNFHFQAHSWVASLSRQSSYLSPFVINHQTPTIIMARGVDVAQRQQHQQQQHSSLCAAAGDESEALMLLENGSSVTVSTSITSTNSTSTRDHDNQYFNRYDSRHSSSSLREEAFADLRILPISHDHEDDDSDVVPLHEEITLADMRTTFCEDLQNMTPGSMPQSVLIGTTIGVFCGLVAYVYYWTLEYLLDFFWHTLPELVIVPYIKEEYHWIWILLLGWTMAICVGASVRFLGEPGDLSYTVQCVHDKAFIGMDHVLPMVMASLFSILGGGSLGPEVSFCLLILIILTLLTVLAVGSILDLLK
jgi:hypothetical protein